MLEIKDDKILEHMQDEIIEYLPSKSGFNGNRVFLSETSVIKIFKESDYIFYDNEILVYTHLKDTGYVVKVQETGMIDTIKYIKMDRICGIALYAIWHLLAEEQKREIIYQIVNILKEINI